MGRSKFCVSTNYTHITIKKLKNQIIFKSNSKFFNKNSKKMGDGDNLKIERKETQEHSGHGKFEIEGYGVKGSLEGDVKVGSSKETKGEIPKWADDSKIKAAKDLLD